MICPQATSAGKQAAKAQQQLTTDKDRLLQELQAARQGQATADARAGQLAADLACAEQKWQELQFLCEQVGRDAGCGYCC
jgi:flagellar biosynthesis/type III secretory pathway chaperone